MSKQTNAFQKMIFNIHEQLEGTDAEVLESYPMDEIFGEKHIKREIDVLIRKVIDGTSRLIAIECRDRTKGNSIMWIDSLVGKYKNLPVQEIIAVSKSPFSKAAKLKADYEGINLYALEDAENINWNEEFTKLGLLKIKHDINLYKFSLTIEPSIEKLSLDLELFDKQQNNYGTIRNFVYELLINYQSEKLLDEFSKEGLSIQKSKEDFYQKILLERHFESNNENMQLFFYCDGEKYLLKEIIMQFFAVPTIKEIAPKKYKYENALIREYKTDSEDGASEITFYVSQLAGDNKMTSYKKITKKPSKKMKVKS